MPPALLAVLLDPQTPSAAAGACRPVASVQGDRHDHAVGAERHVLDRCSREVEHPLECGSDPHVVLPRRPLNFEHPAACRRGRRRVAAFCANSEDQLHARESGSQQALPQKRGRHFTPKWTGEPLFLVTSENAILGVALEVAARSGDAAAALIQHTTETREATTKPTRMVGAQRRAPYLAAMRSRANAHLLD